MNEFFSNSTFFSVTLTLVAFSFASACQKKWKLAILNPILISAALIIVTLKLLDIPNTTYQAGCQILSYLLVIGVLAGTAASIGSIYLLSTLFGLDKVLTISLLPKSVTTAIGVALSSEIGGISAVTTAAIVITGTFGNVAGPALCKLFRLKSEVAQGVAFGTSAHVIGTSKATELSELAGAVSSLSLTIAGIATCIVLSFLAQFI